MRSGPDNSKPLQAVDQPPEPGSIDNWYVVYTQPKSELLAADHLSRQGFEVYLAMYKTYKKSPEGTTSQSVPMFPRYVFFRPKNAGQSISVARSTRGVSFVLSFGFQVAVIKNAYLGAIKAFEAARNCLDAGQISPFQPGIKVRLSDAPMRGLEGLVTSISGQRVKVLLELLGKQLTVNVDQHRVELA